MQKSQLASVLLRSQHRCLQSTTLERRLASLRRFHYSSINAAEQDVRDTQGNFTFVYSFAIVIEKRTKCANTQSSAA